MFGFPTVEICPQCKGKITPSKAFESELLQKKFCCRNCAGLYWEAQRTA